MPRPRSTSGEIDDLPVYFRRAHGLDKTWAADGHCRNHAGIPGRAWTVEPSERVEIAGVVVRGAQLEAQAEIVCQSCPVQWQCTSFAIVVGEKVGTWGVKYDTLKQMMLDTERSLRLIAAAQDRGDPVKLAWARSRRV